MNTILRIFWILSLLIFMQPVWAAISVVITPAPAISITPGVDVIRQTVSTLMLESDQPYQIQLSDDNAGRLLNGAEGLPYRVSYNNGADFVLSSNSVVLESGASVSNAQRPLAVTIWGEDTAKAIAGEYHVTLTITVTAQ